MHENVELTDFEKICFVLIIIGAIGFAIKFAEPIVGLFIWLILSKLILVLMIVMGIFGFVMLFIRSRKYVDKGKE